MIGNSPEVSNFNRLFLKLNRFICNRRFSPSPGEDISQLDTQRRCSIGEITEIETTSPHQYINQNELMCIQEHVVLSVAVFVGKKHGMMSRVSNFLNTGPFFLTTNLVSALWHHYENMAASENRVLAHFSWRDGICSCVTGLVVGVSGVWLCWSFIYAKYRLFLYQAMATNKQACLVTSDIIRNKFA